MSQAGSRRGLHALRDPAFLRQACTDFPGRVVVGIDAHAGVVATDGWARSGDLPAVELALFFFNDCVSSLIYTEIAQDGMLAGNDVDATLALAAAVSTPVIASGGIGQAAHLRTLNARSEGMLEGVVLGRALYDGTLSLADALRIAAE